MALAKPFSKNKFLNKTIHAQRWKPKIKREIILVTLFRWQVKIGDYDEEDKVIPTIRDWWNELLAKFEIMITAYLITHCLHPKRPSIGKCTRVPCIQRLLKWFSRRLQIHFASMTVHCGQALGLFILRQFHLLSHWIETPSIRGKKLCPKYSFSSVEPTNGQWEMMFGLRRSFFGSSLWKGYSTKFIKKPIEEHMSSYHAKLQ